MIRKFFKEKKIFLGYIILLLAYLFCCLSENTVLAAEKRHVKVAFFPMDGYHIISDEGSYSGMDVEYLDALCEYTKWDVEYVRCNSWEDALKMLSQKKVDLVGSAQYSTERAEI
ncbi:MAG: transporter substrate-binding domain-containing protein, partial [Eubacterium sp.]|nr:transporter substrate-binding domain-containing protein [Eubacterium sp.]